MRRLLHYVVFAYFFVSCSGYRFKKTTNPFEQYGIKSVYIPQFVNRSSVGHVGAIFTKEFVRLLSGFSDLRIYQSSDSMADGVLVGIVDSPKDLNKVLETRARKFAQANIIGERRRFIIPSSTTINLDLKLVLIKQPTKLDLELVKSSLGRYVKEHPKVIFDEYMKLERSFSLVSFGSNLANSGGPVNFTNNFGTLQQSLRKMADEAVVSFKELILYAF